MNNNISTKLFVNLNFKKIFFSSNPTTHFPSVLKKAALEAITFVIHLTKYSSLFNNFISLNNFKSFDAFKKNDLAIFACLCYMKVHDIFDTYGHGVSECK